MNRGMAVHAMETERRNEQPTPGITNQGLRVTTTKTKAAIATAYRDRDIDVGDRLNPLCACAVSGQVGPSITRSYTR